ncbi:unnamed protein product [Phytomonas sp. Hart1]|nr:unnamed protein product [Phytomonas sp. Hart1]|eukprot:CCW69838.1 unnamed protein product [Phytomonas sp. isolate Hart1]
MNSTHGGKKAANASLPPLSLPMSRHGHGCASHRQKLSLPDYKLLAIPRTNNFYATVGGCPCIPRARAHPGSWRLRSAQRQSACGDGYGWKPGPHTVHASNTAAHGKCDTFGNLAFKSSRLARLAGKNDNTRDLSGVSPQKLEDLETLVLEEHNARVLVESDIEQLRSIRDSGTQKEYVQKIKDEERRRRQTEATEKQLNELLNDIRGIVSKPLHQTNMDILRRIIARHELTQENRNYITSRS